MRAHRAHPAWSGGLNERRSTGFRVPGVEPSIEYQENGNDYEGQLVELAAGLARFRERVLQMRQKHPTLTEYEARVRVHARLASDYAWTARPRPAFLPVPELPSSTRLLTDEDIEHAKILWAALDPRKAKP